MLLACKSLYHVGGWLCGAVDRASANCADSVQDVVIYL